MKMELCAEMAMGLPLRRAIRESPLQNTKLEPSRRRDFMSLTTTDSTGHGRKRRSIRLQGYDYFQVGAYYITVCTRNRECLFGNVVDGQMQLNEAGKIIQSVWDELPHSYEGVALNAFIIMPNHVHGVIEICAPVGAIHESPLSSIGKSRATVERVFDRRRMLLAKLVGRFKMVTAKQINALRGSSGEPLWQRNYYEHVIRDDRSLNRIRQYIADNPVQWGFDRENLAASVSVRRGDS
jgi:REP element-mobilizing transposase RayT